MRQLQVISVLVALLSIVIALYFYPILPATIASHWGIDGSANGYSGKITIFGLPLLTLALIALLYLLPKFDPMRKDAAGFEEPYDRFVLAMAAFLGYLNVLIALAGIGDRFNFTQALSPGFALLFYSGGMLLENVKPNWFIGIRTPWTISNPTVWAKTHKLGSAIFKAGGIAVLLGLFLPAVALPLILAFAIAGGAATVVYSFMEFRKTQGK
jgi:uncharacterized membrane protein